MLPLFVSWFLVTVVLIALLIARRRLEAREADWLSIASSSPGDIHNQELIEGKVHRLTPVVHWLEAADVLLLLSLFGLWIYHGLNTVRW